MNYILHIPTGPLLLPAGLQPGEAARLAEVLASSSPIVHNEKYTGYKVTGQSYRTELTFTTKPIEQEDDNAGSDNA